MQSKQQESQSSHTPKFFREPEFGNPNIPAPSTHPVSEPPVESKTPEQLASQNHLGAAVQKMMDVAANKLRNAGNAATTTGLDTWPSALNTAHRAVHEGPDGRQLRRELGDTTNNSSDNWFIKYGTRP